MSVPEWIGESIDEGQLVLQRILHRLDIIDQLNDQFSDGVGAPASDSALAEDDAALAPFMVSHYAGHCLTVALDALLTVSLILRSPESRLRFPVIGQYPVLRTALESAAYGLWVVSPSDPAVRRLRTLRAFAQDEHEEASLVKELAKPKGSDAVDTRKFKARARQAASGQTPRLQKLLQVAQQANLPVGEVRKGMTSIRALLDDVDTQVQTPSMSLRAIWQYISGLAHPSVARMQHASNVDISDTGDDAILNATYTASEKIVLLALDAALMLTVRLVRTTAKRGDRFDVLTSLSYPTPPGWRWV